MCEDGERTPVRKLPVVSGGEKTGGSKNPLGPLLISLSVLLVAVIVLTYWWNRSARYLLCASRVACLSVCVHQDAGELL